MFHRWRTVFSVFTSTSWPRILPSLIQCFRCRAFQVRLAPRLQRVLLTRTRSTSLERQSSSSRRYSNTFTSKSGFNEPPLHSAITNRTWLTRVPIRVFLTFPMLVLSIHHGFSLPESSWVALLSIAHRYEFLNVRERAIREIYNPLTRWDARQPGWEPEQGFYLRPSEKPETPDHLTLVSTAEKYDVPFREVLPSLVELVMREEPLSVAEVEIARLSTLTMYRLARAREDYSRKTTRAGDLNTRRVAKGIVRDIWLEAEKK